MSLSTSLASALHAGIIAAAGDPQNEAGSFGTAVRAIWDFLYSGGFFMLVIGLCSIFAITVILYKAISLKRANVLPPETDRAIRRATDPDYPGAAEALRTAAADGASPLGRIASVAASSKVKSREEALETVQSYARAELVRLDGGIPALEVVITIAPLLGLLGTVAGLVGVFGALGDQGSINDLDPTLLAAGIARALSTTIGGLVVAVPTVIAHSYFSKKIERHSVEMEILIGALVNRLHPAVPTASRQAVTAGPRAQNDPIGDLATAVAAATAQGSGGAPNLPPHPRRPGTGT